MINSLFGIFSEDLNTRELDNTACMRCHKIPEVKMKKVKVTSGGYKMVKDRSSRVDCDASVGKEPSRPQTYHKECWIKEVETKKRHP